jgi:hypothetical protein
MLLDQHRRRSDHASVTRPTIETRYHQMFPILQPAEIERLRRGATADVRRG